jgi:hypothetical protein
VADQQDQAQTPEAAQAALTQEYDYGQEPLPDAAASTPSPIQDSAPTATTQAAPQAVQAQQHPSYLVREAQELGFQDDEIASMPTEQLGQLVQRINSRNRQQQRELPRPVQQQPQRQQQAPPPEPELVADAELAEFDPALQGVVKKLMGKIKEQDQTILQLQQMEVNRHNETRNQAADRLFVSKPEYAQFFGKAGGNRLATATDEASRTYFGNRIDVFRKAKAMLDGNAADSWEDAMDAALTVFMSRNQQASPSATAQPPAPGNPAWDAGGVARPTQRRAQAEPKGEKKARDSVAKFLQESGIPGVNNGTPVTADDFPE